MWKWFIISWLVCSGICVWCMMRSTREYLKSRPWYEPEVFIPLFIICVIILCPVAILYMIADNLTVLVEKHHNNKKDQSV